jgi:CRP/FNR family transcriptional regulator
MTAPPLDRFWYLKRIKVFQALDDPALEGIAAKLIHTTSRKRQTIFRAYDPSDRVYLLRRGRVKLYMLSEDGREITLAILEEGDFFGETALTNPAARQVFAEALDDSQVATMTRDDFLELMRDQPDVALRVTQAMGERLLRTQQQVERLAFDDVSTRLARFLWDAVGRQGERRNGTIRLPLALTHQEMANLLGTTRETLTSTLNRFVDDGIISVESRGILLVTDERALRIRAHAE